MENIITIAKGNWQAQICPELGGNLISLTWEGRQILRKPENLEALKKSPALHGIPLIFPANRTAGARFIYAGEEYHLPLNEPMRNNNLHGALHSQVFSVVEQREDVLVTKLENTDVWYPFPFRITLRDALTETGLTRTLTLENTGKKTMPYTLGYHITFVSPEHFSAPLDQRYLVDENFIPNGQLRELNAEEMSYQEGKILDDGSVGGFYTSRGDTAVIGDWKMTVSEAFDHWVLFNGGGNAGYLCVEPQSGAVNGLNSGICRTLAPGNTQEFILRIEKN